MGKKTKPNDIVTNVPTSIFHCLKFGQASLQVTYKELFLHWNIIIQRKQVRFAVALKTGAASREVPPLKANCVNQVFFLTM